jgi:hypothetical protein
MESVERKAFVINRLGAFLDSNLDRFFTLEMGRSGGKIGAISGELGRKNSAEESAAVGRRDE